MVGMSMTFGTATYSTPHGGPPFHGWKNGFGFGHARGAGSWHNDPSMPKKLRFVPDGDRGLASNPFWRNKSAIGSAASFGIGDRPANGEAKRAGLLPGPDNYGDVTQVMRVTTRNATRSGITLKPHYPSIKEKIRDKALAEAGPGPAKYDTSYKTGQSSWVRPSKVSSFSMQAKAMSDPELLSRMGLPSPDTYTVTLKAGTKNPSSHTTLYDIKMKGKLPADKNVPGAISPGPSRYTAKSDFDKYSMGVMTEKLKVGKEDPEQIERALGSPDASFRRVGGGFFRGGARASTSPVFSSDSTLLGDTTLEPSAMSPLEPCADLAFSTDTTAAPDSRLLASGSPAVGGKHASSSVDLERVSA